MNGAMTHQEDDWGSSEHVEEEHEEGEPWLVSYADMMTLLFGFFVLLYSFAAAKLDDSSEDWVKVKKEIAMFFSGEKVQEDKEGKKAVVENVYAPQSGLDLRRDRLERVRERLTEARRVLDEIEQAKDAPKGWEFAQYMELKSELGKLSGRSSKGPELSSDVDEKGFNVFVPARLMFKADMREDLISRQGLSVLDALIDYVSKVKFKVYIRAECYLDPRLLDPGETLTPERVERGHLATSTQCVRVVSYLREQSGKNERRARFAIAGHGYMDLNRLTGTEVGNGVVVRVMIDEKQKK